MDEYKSYCKNPIFIDYRGLKEEFEQHMEEQNPDEINNYQCPISCGLLDIPVTTECGTTFE